MNRGNCRQSSAFSFRRFVIISSSLFGITFTAFQILITAGAFKPTESKTILQVRDYPSWLLLKREAGNSVGWTPPSLSVPAVCVYVVVLAEKNQLLLLGGSEDWDLRLTSLVPRVELHFSIPFWRNTSPLGRLPVMVVLLTFGVSVTQFGEEKPSQMRKISWQW